MDNQHVNDADASGTLRFQTSDGTDLNGTLLRLAPGQIVFEVYHPRPVIRNSEVLTDVRIRSSGEPIYHGRAVVSNVVHTGLVVVCEATLSDRWAQGDLASSVHEPEHLRLACDRFFHQWQQSYRVIPELKVLIADMHSFLSDLRSWADHIELGIRSMPSGSRLDLELEVIDRLSASMVPALNSLFEKFENVATKVPPELKASHHSFVKRQLHPLVLCAPFAYRTFQKPLGYAGDYEMVNMILRDPREGGSLFAKLLNVWFVSQPPAEAHRNRIRFLTEKIRTEILRVRQSSRKTRIFNLGCGPAGEVQDFLTHSDL